MRDYRVAFWNVENLFDSAGSTQRSDKLKRVLKNELKGWTKTVLKRKVRQLASIIRRMNGGRGPDLLGVCEVESRPVLRLLVDTLAPLGRSYDIAHADVQDRRGIDVAFIYDKTLFKAEEQFSHFIVKRTATRDLFQVNFRTRTSPRRRLIVIGNHWPSRRGGQYQSEPYRIIAGETLAYFHDRITDIHGENVAVLAMGDFNDEPFDRSLVEHALSNRSGTKVKKAKTARFYNLMWPILGDRFGTHYYDNRAQVLDQLLVSRGLVTGASSLKALPDSVQVLRDRMQSTGAYPAPIRFGRGKSLNRNGFSDHYPIACTIRLLDS